MDKTSVIFGNDIDKKTIKKANKNKKKYIKKYGDDSDKDYKIGFEPIKALDFINANNIVFKDNNEEFVKNPLIVGNIRMGFGHYRISIAIASCAKALGFNPVWLDLASFDSTGSKMIRYQNDLYSKASRISQKSKLFNKIVWEPLNRDGFKKLTYNANDQKASELLAPIFRNIPKDIPFVATHAWPSQGAIHGGMTHVVNAIPDNWPMALHLSEGAIHTVQTPYAYLGYKMLNGFDKKRILKGIPDDEIKMVGHYVDHELLVNLEEDNKKRLDRINNNKPLRFLLTVGGAGAGADLFLSMLEHLMPEIDAGRVALFINFGDHLTVYDYFKKNIKNFDEKSNKYFNEYDKLKEFVNTMNDNDVKGIHLIYNKDIFEAVYSTNLLMPKCDLLVTKPSELVFYPIPKLFMRHIGGHEVYGAIHGQEFGDATFECEDKRSINTRLDRLIMDKGILIEMINNINKLKKLGYYDGGYECCKLAKEGLKRGN